MSAYRAEAQDPAKRADSSFMLAVLHYLVDERAAALDQVRLAIEYGGLDDSVGNLDRLLRGQAIVTHRGD